MTWSTHFSVFLKFMLLEDSHIHVVVWKGENEKRENQIFELYLVVKTQLSKLTEMS